uniref:G/T mismatch-specific thymine DNA glycosylase n=1 Tax=Lygus hesperus TaxID=30085 RepID=A0A0A9Z2Z3_LYGHE
MWVMPSSSARCAQLPRAADKVPFYAALKKFRDYLNGVVSEIDEKEMVFSYSKLKNFFEPDVKEEVQDAMCPYDGEKVGTPVSEHDIIKKEDDMSQPKKKRGRPKKIKADGEQKGDEPPLKPKVDDKLGLPKKKRGRPKKVKADSSETSAPQTPSEHSNPPNHCFSPPIQSPSMQSFSMYHQSLYNQRSRSPLPTSYHQSPLQSHGYNQSPQPPSFTHSDLSSEISAAISSEHNPESPALGPPDFEPPANMSEEVSNKSSEEKDDECHFSSPQSKKSYQNYDDFSTDSDSGVRYTQKQMTQDVTSKSLSGLESLVDQIPNITDGEPSHNGVNGDNEPIGSQYSEDSAYMSDYARSHYSPQYSATTTNSYMQQHSNFSVTSLANSSASDSTFSVSSLTGNYQQPTYPNLMGPPMTSMMESNAPLFSNPLDRACRIDSNINMPGNTTIQYPYPQYSAPYPNSSSGFYPTSHNIHMPSPNYPYPSPYAGTSYPQPSYLPNHMFDRMKTDRMDFGGF